MQIELFSKSALSADSCDVHLLIFLLFAPLILHCGHIKPCVYACVCVEEGKQGSVPCKIQEGLLQATVLQTHY
jgi:hypothetical protein